MLFANDASVRSFERWDWILLFAYAVRITYVMRDTWWFLCILYAEICVNATPVQCSGRAVALLIGVVCYGVTSKVWYPAQQYSRWFGTLFKTGPHTLDPIRDIVYFSWQPKIEAMKDLGRLLKWVHATILKRIRLKSPGNEYPFKGTNHSNRITMFKTGIPEHTRARNWEKKKL